MLDIFLSYFMQVLQGVNSQDLQTKLRASFYELSEADRNKAVDIINQSFGDDINACMMILSYLATTIQSPAFLEAILKRASTDNISIFDKINYLHQVNHFVFANGMPTDMALFQSNQSLFDNIVDEICHRIKIPCEYIPYAKRNKKRVMIIVKAILGIKHAPTLILINMTRYLEALGYEVLTISDSIYNIIFSRYKQFWKGSCPNTPFHEHTPLNVNYTEQMVNGMHWEHTEDNFYKEIEDELSYIADFNPEFIVSLGSHCTLEAIAARMTTVLAINVASNPPIAQTPFIKTPANKELTEGLPDSFLIDYDFEYEIDPYGKPIDRAAIGLSKDLFIATIVGNRLDSEITSDYIANLNHIIDKHANLVIMVVGKAEKLHALVNDTPYKDNYIFTGYSDAIRSTISVCDLFINPPRQGGGFSAKIAIECDVPVVTLMNCDVADNVGEHFAVSTLDEMYQVIERHITSPAYHEELINLCEQANRTQQSIDNVANTRQLCEDMAHAIAKYEERNDIF